VAAYVTPNTGAEPTRAQLEATLRDEGLVPQAWTNEPDDEYGWHDHRYHKVLYCASGNITFHTRTGDFPLRPGDRLDVEPGTEPAATVGPEGVECIEAPRFPS
jgi:quercetin dioxygenase-like cupin family protein